MNPEVASISPNSDKDKANRRMALKLGGLSAIGLGFGFALVPLYDVFCKLTGISSSANRATTDELPTEVDKSRLVTVEFTSQVMQGLPVSFRPIDIQLKVNPGNMVQTHYLVRNETNQTVHANAIHSVSPLGAGEYFKKVECFCFQEQVLAPGEERKMLLSFWLDPKLDKKVTDITLSYAMYLQPQNKQKKQS